ncbi:MAG: hypothetical protein ACTSVU_06735 [Promethearchaeota archaeon]
MSETLQEKYGAKTPWILGKNIRIPKMDYPEYREGSLTLPSPGRSLILVLIYVFLFYLVMGGIYLYIREMPALGGNSAGQAIWLYPSTSDAFVIESIVAGIIIFLGGAGFFLIYSSTKHAYNYIYALELLIFGIVFALGSFLLLQYMISVKTG